MSWFSKLKEFGRNAYSLGKNNLNKMIGVGSKALGFINSPSMQLIMAGARGYNPDIGKAYDSTRSVGSGVLNTMKFASNQMNNKKKGRGIHSLQPYEGNLPSGFHKIEQPNSITTPKAKPSAIFNGHENRGRRVESMERRPKNSSSSSSSSNPFEDLPD